MLRSYFSECSRQSFNIAAVVESCRVESRLSFDRGKGIETDCPLLFVAAAAMLCSVRDGKMDTNQQEQQTRPDH